MSEGFAAVVAAAAAAVAVTILANVYDLF